MMCKPIMDEAGHRQVSAAVGAAEAHSSGEIVTILADRSDEYGDVALAWAALLAFAAITLVALFPDFWLSTLACLPGHWNREWSAGGLFGLAAALGIAKFAGVWFLQLWPPLKFAVIPPPIKAERVRNRAIDCFRIGAERRTRGRTGILIYLSMQEHRAEIVADKAIADKVDAAIWGDAMAAMLAELKQGRIAEGMCTAVERVGKVLAEHFPPGSEDRNELPDRLIEV